MLSSILLSISPQQESIISSVSDFCLKTSKQPCRLTIGRTRPDVGFYHQGIATVSQHLQAAAAVNEEGAVKDVAVNGKGKTAHTRSKH